MIERDIWDSIRPFLKRKEIIGIRGARQVGKTTLLKFIQGKFSKKTGFFNMDVPDNRLALANSSDFVERYAEEGVKTFFFDEIQRIENAGELLKIIYDEFEDVKIFISGSSTLEMRTNVLPFLVGRLILFDLHSFNFHEFLKARDRGLAKISMKKFSSLKTAIESDGSVDAPSFQSEMADYFKEYLVFGGYPESVLSNTPEEKRMILRNIMNMYIEKDIVSFFGIHDTKKFIETTKYLSFYVSSLLNLNTISKTLGISYHVVRDYISSLENTYIIRQVPAFHSKLSVELRKPRKIMFMDNGMRNAVINNFLQFDSRDDRGKLLENFVFREIISRLRDWEVKYWRTTSKAEVDFVLEKDGKIVPVEVKSGYPEITRGFRSFIKTYEPETAIVATMNDFGTTKIGKTTIHTIPAWYF